ARPYKLRLFLGVITGVLNGAIYSLMIATAMFVYAAMFPTANADAAQLPIKHLPQFLQKWFYSARDGLAHGLQTHHSAVWAMIAMIPLIALMRGITGYL